VLLCVAVCLGAHAPNLFNVVPRHLRAVGLDEREIGAVMGAFPLASIVAMPLVATLSDRIGRRFPVLAGIVILALSCAAFELAHGFPGYLIARAVMGASWAGVFVGAAIYTAEIAPAGRLAEALGVAGILTLAAMALGPSIGEWIVARATYASMFRLAAGLCALGAVPAALLSSWPRGRPAHRHALGLGLVLEADMARSALTAFLVAAGFGAVTSFLADYTALLGIAGMAPFFHAYVPSAIGARVLCGSWSDKVGRHLIVIPSLAGQALAMLALAYLSVGWQLWPIGALFGFTHGLYYPALMALVVERAPEARRARAVATFNFAFSGGIAASAFLNGFVAQRWGYRAAYLVCASAALAALAVAASDWGATGTRRTADLR
jgi:MFS family permease